jgi:hypothetical protein
MWMGVNILWRCVEYVCNSETISGTFCDLIGLYLSLVGCDLADCTAGQNASAVGLRYYFPLKRCGRLSDRCSVYLTV